MHVKRIFGKNADDSENRDIYLDVLRIDEYPSILNAGGQGYKTRMSWQDGLGESGNQTRKVLTVKITDPQNPPTDRNNPDQYIPLDMIEDMKVFDGGQAVHFRFSNASTDDAGTPIVTKRTVNNKRVYFAPTLDVDDILNSGDIVDAAQYFRDENNVDKGQYVDQEILVRLPAILRGDNQTINGVFNAKIFDADGQFPQDPVPPNET